MKSMSDGEVNKYVYDKLMGDLDGIEASGMFDEDMSTDDAAGDSHGTKVEAHGVSVQIKPVMAGEQTKAAPEVKAAPEDDEDLSELGL